MVIICPENPFVNIKPYIFAKNEKTLFNGRSLPLFEHPDAGSSQQHPAAKQRDQKDRLGCIGAGKPAQPGQGHHHFSGGSKMDLNRRIPEAGSAIVTVTVFCFEIF
jgi:hypothetical protein